MQSKWMNKKSIDSTEPALGFQKLLFGHGVLVSTAIYSNLRLLTLVLVPLSIKIGLVYYSISYISSIVKYKIDNFYNTKQRLFRILGLGFLWSQLAMKVVEGFEIGNQVCTFFPTFSHL